MYAIVPNINDKLNEKLGIELPGINSIFFLISTLYARSISDMKNIEKTIKMESFIIL